MDIRRESTCVELIIKGKFYRDLTVENERD